MGDDTLAWDPSNVAGETSTVPWTLPNLQGLGSSWWASGTGDFPQLSRRAMARGETPGGQARGRTEQLGCEQVQSGDHDEAWVQHTALRVPRGPEGCGCFEGCTWPWVAGLSVMSYQWGPVLSLYGQMFWRLQTQVRRDYPG